jgi:PmbA protein
MDSVFDKGWIDERTASLLGHVAGESDGAEALFRGDEGSHLRLAESRIIQAGQVVEAKVTLRVIADQREARASTTDLTDSGLRRCAALALSRATAAPRASEPLQLSTPTEVAPPSARSLDVATAALDGPTKARWLAEACRAHEADDLSLAGRFHSGLNTMAVRSSAGVTAHHVGSWVDVNLSALERPAGHRASAYRAYFDTRVDESIIDRLQSTVRDECHRAHDPITVDPGAWDVVLAPAAVAELLEWMATIAFSSKAVEDGTSFIAGREGKSVTGEHISLVDDASMPHGIGVPQPFDVEGQPKRRVSLVTSGMAQGVVHDTVSGRRAGCGSTGHAQCDDEFPTSGSRAAHVHLEPGTGTPEEMIQRVERGLLVTRFHYVNAMLEPRRAVMTGLLRDGAFLIEGGRQGRAVQTLRFTDSILEALARIPDANCISKVMEAHNSWFGPSQCFVAPWLLIPGLKFTSGR